MSNNIYLTFYNKSNDVNNSQIVIFQKNVAANFDELAIAWTVIRNCGVGSYHPFVYTSDTMIGAEDSYGNFTPQMLANNGDQFHILRTSSGDELAYKEMATDPNSIELANDLQQGAINANIFKSGKLLLKKSNVSPGQKAVFELKPTLWIGVVSEIDEGDVINSAVISSINTELALSGIKSADIVMTGGGSGANATAFHFSLENVIVI